MRYILPGLVIGSLLTSCGPKQNAGMKGPDYARKAAIEATIDEVQSDIKAGKMSCLDLVNAYIERIEAYNGKINAVTYKNYNQARKRARMVDNVVKTNMQTSDLFCVPVLVKDNMDVKGFPTTAGSKAMLENIPPDDAEVIANLKGNGAIILGKTNMAEWAFSPKRTKSSSAGTTHNAYNLDHVPAGSSGGTASGIAASFALVGLGTDTGNSVRGPSSHLSLVGMRSTHGLLSLDGIVPLVLSSDVVGPMTRTVTDNVILFHAMGGPDYHSALDKNALKGAHIGVVREEADPKDMDKDMNELFENALKDMKAQGAILVDPVEINDIKDDIAAHWGCRSFRKDVHEYLTAPGMKAPISDPYEAYEAGIYSPYTKGAWEYFKGGAIDVATRADGTVCGDLSKSELRQKIKKDLLDAMDKNHLDALVYPSWRYPAALLSRAEEDYKGDNSQDLAPPTGLPAITVPMGFAAGDLPGGLQFLGRENAEGSLYGLAYAYEQATHHRRAPSGFGPVRAKAGK